MQTSRKIILTIMKKYLSIIALALFFSGNAYANKNIENMLENCADDRYLNKTKLNKFSPMLYLAYPKYQELEKKHKSLKEKKQLSKKIVKDQLGPELQKWLDNNPEPHMGIDGEMDFEKFKIKEKKWFIDKNNVYFAILDRLEGGVTKRLEEVEAQMATLIRSQASKFIASKDFDLKFKAKSVDGYLDHYTICEKQYQETPSSFKLKWSD
jgi:hypothetical protein